MFAQLWNKEDLERSMSKSLDREDDGYDHIRKNIHNAVKISGLVKDAVVGASQVAMDIQDAGDAIGQGTSKQARTSSEAGLSIDKHGTKLQKVSQTTPVGHSSIGFPQTGLGSSGTQVIGNSTAPPVRLTLGKQLSFSNSIDNFLSLFNGSGSVSVSFGGRLQAPQDQRVRCYMAYRHMLAGAGTGNLFTPYPSGANIMSPSGNVVLDMTGGNAQSVILPNSQIRDIADGDLYWASYNLADLEDLSWNLNKFKIGPVTDANQTQFVTPYSAVNGNSPKIQLLDDVDVNQSDVHRSHSAIYSNNARSFSVPGATTGVSYTSAPYMYDCVLKQGTVDYLFMNKGESPIEVEVVVFRVKKNGLQGVPTQFDQLTLDTQLEYPITAGMMRKTVGAFGTQRLSTSASSSHTPSATDWVTNPSRPFLPKNRFIDQNENPYVEENRVKLTLNSGQRRPFQLKLGGVKYDPAKTCLSAAAPFLRPDSHTLFNEHSYIVCLAVNGIAMSRQLGGVTSTTNQLTTGPIIGDCYASADLQWYAQYTEEVGAMAYKKVKHRNIFTYGASPSIEGALSTYNDGLTDATKKITSQPVALLTQAQTVRTPQTLTQERTSGGNYHVYSQPTQHAVGGSAVVP